MDSFKDITSFVNSIFVNDKSFQVYFNQFKENYLDGNSLSQYQLADNFIYTLSLKILGLNAKYFDSSFDINSTLSKLYEISSVLNFDDHKKFSKVILSSFEKNLSVHNINNLSNPIFYSKNQNLANLDKEPLLLFFKHKIMNNLALPDLTEQSINIKPLEELFNSIPKLNYIFIFKLGTSPLLELSFYNNNNKFKYFSNDDMEYIKQVSLDTLVQSNIIKLHQNQYFSDYETNELMIDRKNLYSLNQKLVKKSSLKIKN